MEASDINRVTAFSVPRQYMAIELSDNSIIEIPIADVFIPVFEEDPKLKEYFESCHKDNYVSLYNIIIDLGLNITKHIINYINSNSNIIMPIPLDAYPSIRRYYKKKADIKDLLLITATLGVPIDMLCENQGIPNPFKEIDEQGNNNTTNNNTGGWVDPYKDVFKKPKFPGNNNPFNPFNGGDSNDGLGF